MSNRCVEAASHRLKTSNVCEVQAESRPVTDVTLNARIDLLVRQYGCYRPASRPSEEIKESEIQILEACFSQPLRMHLAYVFHV